MLQFRQLRLGGRVAWFAPPCWRHRDSPSDQPGHEAVPGRQRRSCRMGGGTGQDRIRSRPDWSNPILYGRSVGGRCRAGGPTCSLRADDVGFRPTRHGAFLPGGDGIEQQQEEELCGARSSHAVWRPLRREAAGFTFET